MKPGFFSAYHTHTWITQHYNKVIQMLHQQVEKHPHSSVGCEIFHDKQWAYCQGSQQNSAQSQVGSYRGARELETKINIPRYRAKNKCGQETFVFQHTFKGQEGNLLRTKGGNAKGEKKPHKYQSSYFSKYGPSTVQVPTALQSPGYWLKIQKFRTTQCY